ncbi:hypothetical protein Bbelb_157000 [Branchiostoma belcheri]|nr:hypothetical protein Bbelb_157000 [Branchiostoma belcheri]
MPRLVLRRRSQVCDPKLHEITTAKTVKLSPMQNQTKKRRISMPARLLPNPILEDGGASKEVNPPQRQRRYSTVVSPSVEQQVRWRRHSSAPLGAHQQHARRAARKDPVTASTMQPVLFVLGVVLTAALVSACSRLVPSILG